ncbi:MAG: serine/threonine protein kinase [Acidobacteria bacterium]|nr:serine/threonine protein kinase [Acidobacteriota bacterium]
MIGKVIGNYKITSELATGGMGTVYRGHHLHLPREVVVKSILLGAFSPSSQPHLKARFRREAYIQSQLDHPNIVRVYEFFTLEDNYYLVMEYVPGMSLKEFLARHGRPTIIQSVFLLKQALLALMFAHDFSYVDESAERRTGIIHRDIKPANLLLDTKGRLKITDFGIVKTAGDEELTQSGFQPGTVEYMSPEQLLGLEVDLRTDIYCLGATFFEMLTGQLPFPRSSTGSDWEVRKGHIEKEPPSLTEIREEVPEDLASIILRSLRKNPDERFQTAGEFLDAIRGFESGSEQYIPLQEDDKATHQVINIPTVSDKSPHRTFEKAATIESYSTVVKDPLEESITIPLTELSGSAGLQQQAKATPFEAETLMQNPSDSREVFISVPAAMQGKKWPVLVAVAAALVLSLAGGAYIFSGRYGRKTEVKSAAPGMEPARKSESSPSSPTPQNLPRPKSQSAITDSGILKQARSLEGQEQYSDAIRKYEEHQRRNPNASDSRIIADKIASLRQFQGLMTAAQVAMDVQKYMLARQNYTEALKLQPESGLARSGLKEAEARLSFPQNRQANPVPNFRQPRPRGPKPEVNPNPLNKNQVPDQVGNFRNLRQSQLIRRKKIKGQPGQNQEKPPE